ncbi:response regulator [Ktedonobacteria bacterium brp13]|nr:response regulator [Ktedonobacteria bacterium brp13]
MSDVWRIFVVVGDEPLNQSVVNTLRKDGYAVQGVMNGADAVRVLWAEEYDVILCDLNTPGADGFELLQWLRAYHPNTRMIMVGEAGAEDLRIKALESGAVSYLERPLDIRLLKEELRRFLQQTGFSASLDSFDLLDVIQIINMSRNSITLLINTGLEEHGTLRFQNGELIWADYGVLRGEEAFFALAAHKNGTVIQQPWNDQVTSNVTQPLSRLIFQAVQYRKKYANQQYSGEIERVSSAPASTSFATAVQHGDVVDDSPFFFMDDSQEQPVAQQPYQQQPAAQQSYQQQPAVQQPYQQQPAAQQPYQSPSMPLPTSPAVYQSSEPLFPEQSSMTGDYAMPAPVPEESPVKEWWESTAHFARVRSSANTPEDMIAEEALAPTMALDSNALNALLRQMSEPIPVQQPAQQQASLPSWLTDQPTSSMAALPGKAATSRNTPAASKLEQVNIPATPDAADWMLPPQYPQYQTGQTERAERTALPAPIDTDQLLSEPPATSPQSFSSAQSSPVTPASATPYGSSTQLPIASPLAPTMPPQEMPAASLRRASPDWQSGSFPAISHQASSPAPAHQALQRPSQFLTPAQQQQQSPAAADRSPVVPVTQNDFGDSNPKLSTDVLRAQGAARRNYASLVAALQSLGYSVTGFIAAAVVTLDGQPIAQVAVNDIDISKICKYFSTIQKSVLQAFDQEQWGACEDTIITSTQRHLLMRVVGSERRAFQVLITTREANPQDSLEIMANVEGAIKAALS